MIRRSQGSEDLLNLNNEALARTERENRRARANTVAMEPLNPLGVHAENQDQGGQFPQNPNDAAADELQRQQYEQFLQFQQQGQQHIEQQQRHELGSIHTPHQFYQNRAAIQPPAIQRQNYEISHSLVGLVKQYLFNGLPAENPMDHIENYEELCSTTSSNGVPQDFILCKLFHFSLANKASRWLKSLPPGSLRNWSQIRAAFLDHFYTKSKTAALRNKISSFQQVSDESFSEAWERFKEYQRECPHHGYNDELILNIFYGGVNWEYKNSLNAASNGDFMTKTKEEAFILIHNLAASSSNQCQEFDRSVRTNTSDSRKMDALNAKLDKLLTANQRGVQQCDDMVDINFVQDDSEESDEQRDVNYVNDQGFLQKGIAQNRGFNNVNLANLSYRSTNVENPQDQSYPP